MALEIERKYLVNGTSYRGLASHSVQIRQGYLSRIPEHTVRVRTKGEKGYITVKGKNHGAVRLEYEYEIPVTDASEMLGICEPPIIEKIRYYVPQEGLTWEIDEYLGARKGLTVAEIEIDSIDQSFSKPSFIGEEVTGNPEYYNSNL